MGVSWVLWIAWYSRWYLELRCLLEFEIQRKWGEENNLLFVKTSSAPVNPVPQFNFPNPISTAYGIFLSFLYFIEGFCINFAQFLQNLVDVELYWETPNNVLVPMWPREVLTCLCPTTFQSLNHVWLIVTPWTAACQASLSITNAQSLLKLMSIESVMPSNHLILCHSLLL